MKKTTSSSSCGAKKALPNAHHLPSWSCKRSNGLAAGAVAAVIAQGVVLPWLAPTPADIFRHAAPSVVTVTAMGARDDPFSPRRSVEQPQGTGTGFAFIDGEHVVTNAHVVMGAFSVRVNDAPAVVVGVDDGNDVAVVELRAGPGGGVALPPLRKCGHPAVVGSACWPSATRSGSPSPCRPAS
jgi:S1-C subfamily serine protease